ncbi:uncharacterized protein LOC129950735 [Eupeodes corollae]|uniref:uncharacterized protein LOC129943105 n=1 Tax=Eupeodes corollae TaxID=290404 RepID=UPI0024916E4E|nr:uncharacterized protein LOC129943105 [Eupeodes corollae]XP_055918631.1 uncharacterized protein LOC129950735 [Eupeodes corollae]
MPDEHQDRQNLSGELHRVSIKPPPFLQDQPDLFFIQMEAQFNIANIKCDITKYHYVVASLDQNVSSRVSDTLRNPQETNKYEELKKVIIAEFTDSDQKKLRKLINSVELGDLDPSKLLKKMKELAKNQLSDEVLKTLWLERLPDNIRAVICIGSGDLTTLSKQADTMAEMQSISNISAVGSQSEILSRIDALQKQVEELRTSRPGGSRKHDSHKRDLSKSRSKSKPRLPLCRYHFRFGKDAKKCVEPCQFKKFDLSEN